ncbi:hypothetical protein MPTK1_2g06830 [Marchantia polymorpha subsp. ruderalis]|uniref:Uncharacterized protein n=1 Tax=Marchantia polymorpha TaxID=3197 RepID=A0A2R6XDU9_MARPO|nr:hypothetical protein MARPO_0021s0136 [Marchantia polymorpha]BBN01356.1 hypothetical protein Mp_2g06830 [Marchantia polymorpha subsp. ruderalis]|eukprot:PTQ44282.1 hypothetical protein MARPO_0021s0136 [Marchantia polymorpha]
MHVSHQGGSIRTLKRHGMKMRSSLRSLLLTGDFFVGSAGGRPKSPPELTKFWFFVAFKRGPLPASGLGLGSLGPENLAAVVGQCARTLSA